MGMKSMKGERREQFGDFIKRAENGDRQPDLTKYHYFLVILLRGVVTVRKSSHVMKRRLIGMTMKRIGRASRQMATGVAVAMATGGLTTITITLKTMTTMIAYVGIACASLRTGSTRTACTTTTMLTLATRTGRTESSVESVMSPIQTRGRLSRHGNNVAAGRATAVHIVMPRSVWVVLSMIFMRGMGMVTRTSPRGIPGRWSPMPSGPTTMPGNVSACWQMVLLLSRGAGGLEDVKTFVRVGFNKLVHICLQAVRMVICAPLAMSTVHTHCIVTQADAIRRQRCAWAGAR